MPFYTNTPAGVPWNFGSSYQAGTVVLYTDDKLYAANSLIPASTPFTIGTVGATWRVVSDGAAANIPDWLTATAYGIGDYANQGNKLYKALTAHTSGVFATDLAAARWVEVSPSAGSIAAWSTATTYALNDLAIESKKLYRAIIAHTSGVFATDLAAARWEEISADIQQITDWVTATPYLVNDYVNVSGTLYKCIVAHAAAALFATDLAAVNWQLIGAASTVNTITQATHGFAVNDWVAISGGVYVKASAALPTTAEVVGRVATVPTPNTFTVSGTGSYLTGLTGLVAGPYYLSATVPGTIVNTAPSTTGTVSKPVFVADSATSGYVLILRGAVTGSPLANPLIVSNIVDFTVAEPLTPAFGDVYINTGAGVGSTTAAQTFVPGRVYRWLGGPAWEVTVPADGWIAYNQTADAIFTFDGATWSTLTALAAQVVSPDTNTFAQAVNGQLNFVVNGVAVGNMTESGGVGKLTWPGIIDPAAYAGTPQTIAQRDALVLVSPATKAGYFVYVVDGAINEYQVWSGTAWNTVGSGTKPILAWAAATAYKAGDLAITAMGALIQSNSARTSAATFSVIEAGNWTLISATGSLSFPWVANTYAFGGQLNNVNNQVIARGASGLTGAAFDATEAANWSLISQVATHTSFTANNVYLRGTQILVSGTLYERIATGLSGATFDVTEQAAWRVLASASAPGITDWAATTAYTAGQYLYDGHLIKVLLNHTSALFIGDDIANGYVAYVSTPAVRFADSASVPTPTIAALQGLANANPDSIWYYTGTTSNLDPITHVFYGNGTGELVLLKEPSAPGINDWVTATAYTTGQYVETGRKLYKVIADHTSDTSIDLDVVNANVVEVSRAFDDWSFAANNDTALALNSYILTPGNTINMPVSPNDGDAVRFATLTEWAVANITFVAAGATTVADGQVGVLAGYDVVEMVYDSVADNWVALLGGSAAPDVAVPMDASTAALPITLPAATGTGAIKRYVIKDKTNAITFGVQVGEYLNEVINTTYLASNHGVGTYFELVDYATGKWSLQVVGAATSTPLHKYSAAMTAGVGTASSTTLPLSATQINSKFDPHGMGVGNTVVIQQAGLYRVDFSSLMSGNSVVSLRVNGVSKAAGFFSATSTSAIQWAGNLVVGDVITLVSDSSTTWSTPSLVVQQLPDSTVVLAGMVTPTPLHVVSIATTAPDANSMATVLTESGVGGYYVPNLTDPMLTKYDPDAMIVGNKVVIKQAGRYRLSAGLKSISGTPEPGIRVNGVYVATGDASGATDHLSFECVRVLAVGNIVDFCVNAPANSNANNSFRLIVQQLPDSTVVNPGDVPVQTLNKFEARKNATQSIPNSANTDIAFGTLTSSEGSGYNPATGVFTAPSAGWYSFDAAVRMDYEFSAVGTEMFIAIHVNGAEKARGGFAFVGTNASVGSYHYANASVSVPLAAGDQVKLQCRQNSGTSLTLNGAGSLNYFTGVQTSSHSVVRPEDTVVNDQGASGYFDVGTMRLAWGSATTTPAGTLAITLPGGGFANAGYAFTPSSVLEGFDARETVPAKTATIVNVRTVNANSTTLAGNVPFTWFAIGLKP